MRLMASAVAVSVREAGQARDRATLPLPTDTHAMAHTVPSTSSPLDHSPVTPLQILRVKDVILSWGGVPVANDGTIELPGRPDERVDFTHLVLSSHLGDEVDVEVWRSEHVAGCEPGRQGQVRGERWWR